jgi:magnesium-dependent phosphatase 1
MRGSGIARLVRFATVMAAAKKPPPMVVFDLDACCWYPEMYQLWGDSPPFTPTSDPGCLKTARGTDVRLLGDTRQIWRELHEAGMTIGVASRSDEPAWARECLQKFAIDDADTSMWDAAGSGQLVEIYKGSKQGHFRELQRKTSTPFEHMLFFDDDPSNIRDVSALGVTCVLTPKGVTRDNLEEGLRAYAGARARKR